MAGEKRHVFLDGRSYLLVAVDPLHQAGEGRAPRAGLAAPMPGKVIALLAKPGHGGEGRAAAHPRGDEDGAHDQRARAGKLRGFRYAVGDQVAEGAELVDFEPHAGDARREPDPEAV